MQWGAGLNGLSPPAPSSVLAAVSTAHIALALIRRHRSATALRGGMVGAISALFAAAPWIWASPRDLALGVGAHLCWYAASGALAGRRTSRPPASTSFPRPVLVARSPAAESAAPPARKAPGPMPTPVLAVFDETPEIRTFRLARPEGFTFQPGQFLTVQVQLDGRSVARCYSISSSPDSRGYLEISVKRQGLVSRTLHSTVRPGALLSIRPPAGGFVYPAGDARSLVLVSGGVGCTPLISMLRYAVSHEPSRPLIYLHSARTEADVAFRQELELLSRRHPQVRVVLALTRAAAVGVHYPGRVDEKLLRSVVPSPAESLFYVCGPAAMIADIRTTLVALRVPPGQVRSEAFASAVAASKPIPSAGLLEPVPTPVLVGAEGERRRLRLAISGKVATACADQSLLDCAEAAGVEIPNVCRAGTCGTCRTRLLSGDVECNAEVMDDADRRGGWVYPCVTLARSDCVLEA